MMIFTDGSALGNPGPTGSGVVIKKNGPESTEIKIAHAVTKMGTSYQGELQAIRIGTTYAKENISISTENLHIFVDSQAAIQAIIEQNHKNYHNITITEIRQNLINISHSIKSIKFVYCPAHKGIVENETADKLAKIAAKKMQTLEPTYIVSSSEIKTENKKMTLSKWQRRWNNTKDNKYKNIAPTISKEELKQRALHLKHTSRKGASKIIRLKSGHCMLKSHRRKIDLEITPDCDHCKVKETPSHLLLHCKVFDSE